MSSVKSRMGHFTIVGVVLAIALPLLAGCRTDVKVKCGPGMGAADEYVEGVGACNPIGWVNQSANGFYITATTTYTGNHVCNSGTRCAKNPPYGPGPGKCNDGVTNCKSWVNTTTWACKCDCNP
jgi:hypothetical protein